MAVTSPLVPLSPLRAAGRGSLCAVVVLQWKNLHILMQGQKYTTRQPCTQTRIYCTIEVNAQAYALSAVAASPNFFKYKENCPRC